MAAPVDELNEELGAFAELLPDHLLGVQPGAGLGFVQALDSRWWWRFESVRFLLTSSAAVANRFVTVDYCDPEGNAWVRAPALAVQPAAVAQEYDFQARNVGVSGVAGAPQFADLPKVIIPPGWQLRINVAAIDVADQLSAIRLYVAKFLPA